MKSSLLFIFYLVCIYGFTQQTSSPHVSSTDLSSINIISVSQQGSDSVAVTFKAGKKNGVEARLELQHLNVKEGDTKCEIISFEKIIKASPLKIAIVMDYSSSTGSGRFAFSQFFEELDTLEEKEETFSENPFSKNILNFPERLPASKKPGFSINHNHSLCVLDFSKIAVRNFVHRFNDTRDSICIIGIGEDVEVVYPLTRVQNYFDLVIDRIKPAGGTPLFDGIELACAQMKLVHGIKAIVVVCDGGDNGSETKKKQLIKELDDKTLPVYVVDMGTKADDRLKSISENSGGKYYSENSVLPLETISRQIKEKATEEVIYRLVYRKPGSVKTEPAKIFMTDKTNGHINPLILKTQKEIAAEKQNGAGQEQGK